MAQASAQASSTQRDPSMEEILSSIRRIIEDNDPGDEQKARVEAVASATVEPEAPIAEASPEPEMKTAANDPVEQVSETVAELPTVERAPVKHTSLEEIRSQIASEAEVAIQDETSDDDGFEIFEDATATETAEPMRQDTAPGVEKSIDEEWEQEFTASDNEASADEPADIDNDAVVAAVANAVSAEVKPSAPTSILSPDTERQVAASFEELSKAFISSRAESYDKMAEDLMRPMLQEWLDNNLPTLVEKLVREEIERVARGGSGQ